MTAKAAFGHVLAYLLGIAIGIDVLTNAIFAGAPYTTISCRVFESIEGGGWASHVHWPAWWVAHCKASTFNTTV